MIMRLAWVLEQFVLDFIYVFVVIVNLFCLFFRQTPNPII